MPSIARAGCPCYLWPADYDMCHVLMNSIYVFLFDFFSQMEVLFHLSSSLLIFVNESVRIYYILFWPIVLRKKETDKSIYAITLLKCANHKSQMEREGNCTGKEGNRTGKEGNPVMCQP